MVIRSPGRSHPRPTPALVLVTHFMPHTDWAGCVGRRQTGDHRGLIEETKMAIFIFTLTWVLQPELRQLFKLGTPEFGPALMIWICHCL